MNIIMEHCTNNMKDSKNCNAEVYYDESNKKYNIHQFSLNQQ